MIEVKFFAHIREQLGVDSIQLSCEEERVTMASVLNQLVSKGEPWSLALADNVLMACNHDLVDKNHWVKDGDEVAFFPPVTGG